jgi:predicted lipid-binding transport protein (Tim44 family)
VEPRAHATYKARNLKAVNDEKTDTVITPWNVPADFDVPRFLRKCKAYFMRLQSSWDNADVKDIRRFTTRELFGAFCKQLNERGKEASVTEVVTLGAELQGVETVGEYYIATVKFTGMVKEDQAEVAPFSEVWNLSKPLDGHRSWVLAKIQQPV